MTARLEGEAGSARALAAALVARGRIGLVAAIEGGRAHLCFARPPGAGPAMNELLKGSLTLLRGKGGGTAEHAQGSGDPDRVVEALDAAQASVLSHRSF